MNLRHSYRKNLLLLFTLSICIPTFSQVDKIVNSTFPENWDMKKELRGENGKVLLWKYAKNDNKSIWKSCLLLFSSPDSTGNIEYSLSEMYADKKPFNKWHYAWIHYLPNVSDTSNKLRIGYFDTHIITFTHKPSEKEIYDLLEKWEFNLIDKFSTTIEAGIDEKLWLDTFGFVPNKVKFINK